MDVLSDERPPSDVEAAAANATKEPFDYWNLELCQRTGLAERLGLTNRVLEVPPGPGR